MNWCAGKMVKGKVIWIILLTALVTQVQGKSSGLLMLQEMLNLIQKGQANIELSEDYKDAVFVLGNIGVGKTTLVQWLVGKEKLEAVPNGFGFEGSDFIIQDRRNKINRGNPNEPKTIYPELFIDSETNTAFYDFPGFSDNRNTASDVANSVFTRRVVNHVEGIKIVLLAEYDTVKIGSDRSAFMKLLKHTRNLVKGMALYFDGICLVIVKVDNNLNETKFKEMSLTETTLADDNDNAVIQYSIVPFLKDVLKQLDVDFIRSSSAEEQNFYVDAIFLIRALLHYDEKTFYSKISLFKKPHAPSFLSDSLLLESEKEKTKEILTNNIAFIPKSSSCFTYAISNRSRNDILALVEELKTDLLGSFSVMPLFSFEIPQGVPGN